MKSRKSRVIEDFKLVLGLLRLPSTTVESQQEKRVIIFVTVLLLGRDAITKATLIKERL